MELAQNLTGEMSEWAQSLACNNTAVFCSLLLKSYYLCQQDHTLTPKLNTVQIHQRVQEPAEKMPHTKKKRGKMLHRNLRNALANMSAQSMMGEHTQDL